ncbi:hypothetical protein Tco_1115787, partial [Tanacetum coccineum]
MAKEEASLRRLQEKRDAAVFAIANVLGKRKSRQMEEQGSRPIVEEKPSDYKASKSVMAKEEALLRRLQEKRDAAVVAIANVPRKRKSRQM